MARLFLRIACLSLAVAACGGDDGAVRDETATISLLFAGDAMVGRGIAPIVRGDPDGLFRDVRHVVRGADVAFVNLESPLTDRPHLSANPNALAGDPGTARLIASAGFDIVNLANNHAADSGPTGIIDTAGAIDRSGMIPTGWGATWDDAFEPTYVEREGITIAVLGFDLGRSDPGVGPNREPGPHVAGWDADRVREAVRRAGERADIVVASIHGGVEYLPEPDPRVRLAGETLADWGVDIVWGHGPHVAYPPRIVRLAGRSAIIADSLGNLLFDQRGPATGVGTVLEVVVGADGVRAFRTGSTSHHDLRVHFTGWEPPPDDAVFHRGSWWALVAPGAAVGEPARVDRFRWGDVVSASRGAITSRARDEYVVSFRKPAVPHIVRDARPDVVWTDAAGRTAHLGIYDVSDMTARWVASVVPAPVSIVTACDGAVAVAYTALDDPEVVATGAAVWRPRALVAAEALPGDGVPACVDVDGDGRREPAVIDR